MAYISKQQQQQLLKQIPQGQDPVKVFQGLIDRGNQLEGYAAPTDQPLLPSGPSPDNTVDSKDGFFKSAVKGILSPITKGLASGYRSIQATPDVLRAIGGNKDAQARADATMAKPVGYQKTLGGDSIAGNLGTAANAGSYLLSPVLSGVIGGAGQSLEQGGSYTDAALAGATGGVLNKFLPGAASKVYSKLPQGVKNTIAGGVDKVATALSPISKGLSKVTTPIGQKLESKVEQSVINTNREILNVSAKTLNKEANTGKDVAAFLAKERIPLHVENGQAVLDGARSQVLQSAKVEDALLSSYLKTEPKLTPLREAADAAVAELKGSGINKEHAAAYIEKQIEAFIKQTPGAAVEHNGTLYLSMEGINDIKGKGWSNVANFADPNASVINDANTAIGRGFKKLIENNVKDVKIQEFNQRLGDWYHAAEVLNERNGKKVANRRLGPLVNRGVGAVAGTLTGSPGGTIAGAFLGDKLTSMMTDNGISNEIKLAFLNKLKSTPEGSAVVAQVEQKLKMNLQDLLDRQLNPARQLGAGPIIAGATDRSGMRVTGGPIPPANMGMAVDISKGGPKLLPAPTTIFGTTPDKSFMKTYTGDVPPPSVAKGSGMFVKSRKNLKVSDIPKVRVK